MKKIIPFKKDIIFKTNLSEITSISLEHTLKTNDKIVEGNFILSGEYKIADSSINVDSFSYDLPFSINFDEKYNLSKAICDIDDFYYEIVNENVLAIHIDVCVDKIEEIIIEDLDFIEKENDIEFDFDEIREDEDILNTELEDKRCIEEEDEEVEQIESLFDNMDTSKETYKTYKVYIVRENDSIESIMEKYMISKETLELYNELTELKIGDKIIIPDSYETD